MSLGTLALVLVLLGLSPSLAAQTLGTAAARPESRLVSVDNSSGDRIWQQADQAWRNGEQYKPGRMRIVSSELDRHGQVSTTTTTELALRYNGSETQTEVVSASKDGKDITAQTRADYARRNANNGAASGGPFDPDDLIPFTASARPDLRRGPIRLQDGQAVVPYEIVKKKGGSAGELFFDAGGWPVRMRYSLQPLPPLVSIFEGEVLFGRVGSSALVASSMSFMAEGGILLVKKRYAISMEFSEYSLVSTRP